MKGRPSYAAHCRPPASSANKKDLVAVTPADDGKTSIYELDLEGDRAAAVAELPVSAHALAFSADCSHLLTGHSASGDHRATLFQLRRNGEKLVPQKAAQFGPYPLPVLGIALDFATGRVAIGTNSGSMQLYDVRSGAARELGSDPGPKDREPAMTATFQKDQLFVGYFRGRVRAFRAKKKLELDTDSVVTAGPNREKGFVNLETGEIVVPGGSRIWSIESLSDGLLILDERGSVTKCDTSGQTHELVSGLVNPSKMAVSPGGSYIAVAGGPGSVWRLGEKAQNIADLNGFDRVGTYDAATGISFADDKTVLVVGFLSPTVRVYRLP